MNINQAIVNFRAAPAGNRCYEQSTKWASRDRTIHTVKNVARHVGSFAGGFSIGFSLVSGFAFTAAAISAGTALAVSAVALPILLAVGGMAIGIGLIYLCYRSRQNEERKLKTYQVTAQDFPRFLDGLQNATFASFSQNHYVGHSRFKFEDSLLRKLGLMSKENYKLFAKSHKQAFRIHRHQNSSKLTKALLFRGESRMNAMRNELAGNFNALKQNITNDLPPFVTQAIWEAILREAN